MPTLLTYTFSTNPSPLPASLVEAGAAVATLVVLATNLTSANVPMQGISVLLPVGTEGNQLTSTPDLITAVAPAGWPPATKTPQAGGVKYVFRPPTNQPGLTPGKALAFSFNQVQPNTQVGTVPVLVTEGSAGNPTQTLLITKFPGSWGAVNFWVAPLEVAAGTGVQLAWNGPVGGSYSIHYYDFATGAAVTVPAPGQPLLHNSGTYPGPADPPLRPTQTTTYTLLVNATIGGEVVTTRPQTTVAVQVPAPRILKFQVEPEVVPVGPSRPPIRLVWKTEHTSSLHVEGVGDFSGSEALQGSCVIAPRSSRKYLATGYGLPNSPPPPAAAAAWVIYRQSQVFECVLASGVTPAGPFVITFEPGNLPLKIIGDRTKKLVSDLASTSDLDAGLCPPEADLGSHSLEPKAAAADESTTWFLELPPGFEMADLRKYRPNVTYENIIGAAYGNATRLQRELLTLHYNSSESGGWASFHFDMLWGVRLPNGTYGTFWLSAVTAEPSGRNLRSFNVRFTCNWVHYEGGLYRPPDEPKTVS